MKKTHTYTHTALDWHEQHAAAGCKTTYLKPITCDAEGPQIVMQLSSANPQKLKHAQDIGGVAKAMASTPYCSAEAHVYHVAAGNKQTIT